METAAVSYDVCKFNPKPSSDYLCPICHCVLSQPRMCPCQHIFCKECIETWLGRNATSPTCPTCRSPAPLRQVKPAPPLIQSVLNSLTMDCDFKEKGCAELVVMERFPAHLAQCLYRAVKCPHKDCSAEITARELKAHQSSCQYRLLRCTKVCKLQIPACKMDTHTCSTSLVIRVEELKRWLAQHQVFLTWLRHRLNQYHMPSQSMAVQLQAYQDMMATINNIWPPDQNVPRRLLGSVMTAHCQLHNNTTASGSRPAPEPQRPGTAGRQDPLPAQTAASQPVSISTMTEAEIMARVRDIVNHPSTTRIPPPSTTRMPPTSATRIPPSSATRIPPSSNTGIPPSSTTRIPPSFTTRIPAPSTARIPAPSTARIPLSSTSRIPPPSTVRFPPSSSTRIPPPSTSRIAPHIIVNSSPASPFTPTSPPYIPVLSPVDHLVNEQHFPEHIIINSPPASPTYYPTLYSPPVSFATPWRLGSISSPTPNEPPQPGRVVASFFREEVYIPPHAMPTYMTPAPTHSSSQADPLVNEQHFAPVTTDAGDSRSSRSTYVSPMHNEYYQARLGSRSRSRSRSFSRSRSRSYSPSRSPANSQRSHSANYYQEYSPEDYHPSRSPSGSRSRSGSVEGFERAEEDSSDGQHSGSARDVSRSPPRSASRTPNQSWGSQFGDSPQSSTAFSDHNDPVSDSGAWDRQSSAYEDETHSPPDDHHTRSPQSGDTWERQASDAPDQENVSDRPDSWPSSDFSGQEFENSDAEDNNNANSSSAGGAASPRTLEQLSDRSSQASPASSRGRLDSSDSEPPRDSQHTPDSTHPLSDKDSAGSESSEEKDWHGSNYDETDASDRGQSFRDDQSLDKERENLQDDQEHSASSPEAEQLSNYSSHSSNSNSRQLNDADSSDEAHHASDPDSCAEQDLEDDGDHEGSKNVWENSSESTSLDYDLCDEDETNSAGKTSRTNSKQRLSICSADSSNAGADSHEEDKESNCSLPSIPPRESPNSESHDHENDPAEVEVVGSDSDHASDGNSSNEKSFTKSALFGSDSESDDDTSSNSGIPFKRKPRIKSVSSSGDEDKRGKALSEQMSEDSQDSNLDLTSTDPPARSKKSTDNQSTSNDKETEETSQTEEISKKRKTTSPMSHKMLKKMKRGEPSKKHCKITEMAWFKKTSVTKRRATAQREKPSHTVTSSMLPSDVSNTVAEVGTTSRNTSPGNDEAAASSSRQTSNKAARGTAARYKGSSRHQHTVESAGKSKRKSSESAGTERQNKEAKHKARASTGTRTHSTSRTVTDSKTPPVE